MQFKNFLKKIIYNPITAKLKITKIPKTTYVNNKFKLNLNFDYFKIPSVSNIMKNQSLKREAWVELKLLKAKLNES